MRKGEELRLFSPEQRRYGGSRRYLKMSNRTVQSRQSQALLSVSQLHDERQWVQTATQSFAVFSKSTVLTVVCVLIHKLLLSLH